MLSSRELLLVSLLHYLKLPYYKSLLRIKYLSSKLLYFSLQNAEKYVFQ